MDSISTLIYTSELILCFTTLLRLAELVLALNCFSFAFADGYYKQIDGVAMGTKMGASFENLFVDYIEHQFSNQYNGRPKPDLYRRYIDDWSLSS